MTSLRIDIVSDVVCPWCIIGYKHLEQALSRLPHITPEIHWHPFELNSNMPPGGQNLREHLSQKYGTTREQSIAARKRLTDLGASLGFRFNYQEESRMYNTFQAHQLLHWAGLQGVETQTALKLALFEAYFSDGKAIDETDVLLEVVGNLGLDRAEAEKALVEGTYAATVREQINHWLSRGIHGVPAVIIDQSTLLSGAQPIEVFVECLERAATAKT